MELDTESIRTLNRLPQHAKHCLRYRATQLTVMREVEMRLSPPDPTEKALKIFQDEGRELSLLDAPWFLPVLEAGTFQDRPFYLVPLRRYPSLEEALGDARFGTQERFWAVRHLAGMMASLHDVQGALGPPYLDLLAWNWSENQLVCLHHKHLPRPQPTWLTGPLPEDMQSGSKWSARTDLFLWGAFAYWLLTDGEQPYEEGGGEPTPIRRLRPGLSGELAQAIEACLAWDVEERPRDAVELRSVLQQSPANEATGEPGQEVASEASAEAPEYEAFRPSSVAFKVRVDELRKTGRVPETGDSGLVQSFVAVGQQAVEQLRGSVEVAEESRGPMLVAGLVFLVLLGALLPASWPRQPVLRSPTRNTPPPPTTKVLLAPSHQANLLEEPLVRSLLDLPPVTVETFDDTWVVLRKVVLAGKLPPGLMDASGLVELRRRRAVEPEAAVGALRERIEEIRRTLGASQR